MPEMDSDQNLDMEQDEQDSSVVRELRKQLEKAQTEAKRTAELERQLVLHQAGLNKLSAKQVKALSAAHDGDWDSESVQATAAELGFSASSQETVEETKPPIPESEMQSMDAVQAAQSHSGNMPPAQEDLNAKIRATKSPEELMALLEGVTNPDGTPLLIQD